MTDPAQTALAEFNRRRVWLRAEVAAFRVTLDQAEERLRPWLAIALRAGSDLSALGEPIAAQLREYPADQVTEAEARALVADDLCQLATARDHLAKARDAAIEAFDRAQAAEGDSAQKGAPTAELGTAARNLCALADHLHAPAYRRVSKKEAA